MSVAESLTRSVARITVRRRDARRRGRPERTPRAASPQAGGVARYDASGAFIRSLVHFSYDSVVTGPTGKSINFDGHQNQQITAAGIITLTGQGANVRASGLGLLYQDVGRLVVDTSAFPSPARRCSSPPRRSASRHSTPTSCRPPSAQPSGDLKGRPRANVHVGALSQLFRFWATCRARRRPGGTIGAAASNSPRSRRTGTGPGPG